DEAGGSAVAGGGGAGSGRAASLSAAGRASALSAAVGRSPGRRAGELAGGGAAASEGAAETVRDEAGRSTDCGASIPQGVTGGSSAARPGAVLRATPPRYEPLTLRSRRARRSAPAARGAGRGSCFSAGVSCARTLVRPPCRSGE